MLKSPLFLNRDIPKVKSAVLLTIKLRFLLLQTEKLDFDLSCITKKPNNNINFYPKKSISKKKFFYYVYFYINDI